MSLRTDYLIHPQVIPYERYWVPPFGNLRIKALWRLPEAYRSLIRPSSPHDAKASVVRPYTLSKKSRYLVYVAILFNFQLPFFKDQPSHRRPASPQVAQRVNKISKQGFRCKRFFEKFFMFFRRRENPMFYGVFRQAS